MELNFQKEVAHIDLAAPCEIGIKGYSSISGET